MKEENKEGCKSCRKNMNNGQKFMIVFSVYILSVAVYGTIKLVEEIMTMF
jgi:hypothetical protein